MCGIGSSAAVEVGTLGCLNAYLGTQAAIRARLARLAQIAENHVVGAPCGIMDQISVTSGRAGSPDPHPLAARARCSAKWKFRLGTGFVGINSMVRHSVAGSPYADTRIGAFMGKKIINQLREAKGREPAGLFDRAFARRNIRRNSPATFPSKLSARNFSPCYKTHDDPVTKIQPDATYRVAGPTRHPVEENERVLRFMDCLRAAKSGEKHALEIAGEYMFAAHDSYRDNCRLSIDEVDFLVDSVRRRGPKSGLFGAKITGGGSGGTVAVFGRLEALREQIPQIATEFSRRVGVMPDIFEGTSPGGGGVRRAALPLWLRRLAEIHGLIRVARCQHPFAKPLFPSRDWEPAISPPHTQSRRNCFPLSARTAWRARCFTIILSSWWRPESRRFALSSSRAKRR